MGRETLKPIVKLNARGGSGRLHLIDEPKDAVTGDAFRTRQCSDSAISAQQSPPGPLRQGQRETVRRGKTPITLEVSLGLLDAFLVQGLDSKPEGQELQAPLAFELALEEKIWDCKLGFECECCFEQVAPLEVDEYRGVRDQDRHVGYAPLATLAALSKRRFSSRVLIPRTSAAFASEIALSARAR
jgi:hypothetical protein